MPEPVPNAPATVPTTCDATSPTEPPGLLALAALERIASTLKEVTTSQSIDVRLGYCASATATLEASGGARILHRSSIDGSWIAAASLKVGDVEFRAARAEGAS